MTRLSNNNLDKRQKIDMIFRVMAQITTWSSLFILAILLYHISISGIDRLSFDFFRKFSIKISI